MNSITFLKIAISVIIRHHWELTTSIAVGCSSQQCLDENSTALYKSPTSFPLKKIESALDGKTIVSSCQRKDVCLQDIHREDGQRYQWMAPCIKNAVLYICHLIW